MKRLHVKIFNELQLTDAAYSQYNLKVDLIGALKVILKIDLIVCSIKAKQRWRQFVYQVMYIYQGEGRLMKGLTLSIKIRLKLDEQNFSKEKVTYGGPANQTK